MSNLPTSNLQLDVIAAAITESTTDVIIRIVCLSNNVDGDKLDPTYCSGTSGALRLANLRSTPYNMGKFRNYSYTVGGLTYFVGTTVIDKELTTCGTKRTTDYWHDGSGDFPEVGDTVFTDSAGTTYPDLKPGNFIGYTDTGDSKKYWIGLVKLGLIATKGQCLTAFDATAMWATWSQACNDVSSDIEYWHDGIGTPIYGHPVVGDAVYTNSSGSTPVANGYYHFDTIGYYFRIDAFDPNGPVVLVGNCNP